VVHLLGAGHDLVESRNEGTNTVNFRPTVSDNDPSTANGQPNNGTLTGGIFLPEEGMGYYHFYGADARFTDNWGTLKLIKIIEEVAREWNQSHPDGPRIGVGDMSLRAGGLWIDHASHQNGLDVDLRYLRSDGAESGYTFPNTGYSQTLTQELIDLFCATGEIDTIFYDTRSNITIPNHSYWL